MVVNPVVVVGPALAVVHTQSSLSLVRDLYAGKYPACPNLGFGFVDVRDVVKALLKGLEDGITGRHLLWESSRWLIEIAGMVKKSDTRNRAPLRKLPGPFLYLAALFDERLSLAYVKRNLGRKDRFSNQRLVGHLGIRPIPIEKSIADTCESLVELGAV